MQHALRYPDQPGEKIAGPTRLSVSGKREQHAQYTFLGSIESIVAALVLVVAKK